MCVSDFFILIMLTHSVVWLNAREISIVFLFLLF